MSENAFIQDTPMEMATGHLHTFVHKRQNKNWNSEHDLHELCMRDVPIYNSTQPSPHEGAYSNIRAWPMKNARFIPADKLKRLN